MNRARAEWLVIGRIVGAFGIRGEAKIDPQTDYPERFERADHLYLGDDHRRVQVQTARTHKNQVLLKLEGVDSPEAVVALRGLEVMVPREEALPLPAGHYYLADIVGMEVITVEGQIVGHVTDVFRTGSNDVYVVGHGVNEVLIPAIQDAVTNLDLENGRITVDQWVLEPAE